MLLVIAFVSLLVLLVGAYLRVVAGWNWKHQLGFGFFVLCYAAWLALGTGTVTKLVIPGVGSIALGAVAGGALGFAAYLILGVVGLAGGGIAVALGWGAMSAIGAAVGGLGATAGAFGLVRVPLVAMYIWLPIMCWGAWTAYRGYRRRPTPIKEVTVGGSGLTRF